MDNSNSTATKKAQENTDDTKDKANNSAGNTIEKVKQQIQTGTDKVSEVTGKYKEKVSENLSDAAGAVHQKSDNAQEFLVEKAGIINEYAQQTIEKANQLGHRAANLMESSSDYVKNFDLQETRQQISDNIKEKPELSIAIAGVFGLLVGLLIGRKR